MIALDCMCVFSAQLLPAQWLCCEHNVRLQCTPVLSALRATTVSSMLLPLQAACPPTKQSSWSCCLLLPVACSTSEIRTLAVLMKISIDFPHFRSSNQNPLIFVVLLCFGFVSGGDDDEDDDDAGGGGDGCCCPV